MATNTRRFGVPASAVWATLADGYTYGDWVVGTSGIRDVDAAFPAIGTRIHYSVGHRPIRHDGHTEVLDAQQPRRLELEAHAWPLGTARILLEVAPDGDGCTVSITEHPSSGPGKLLDSPVSDLLIKLRNVETLRRLERIARTRS